MFHKTHTFTVTKIYLKSLLQVQTQILWVSVFFARKKIRLFLHVPKIFPWIFPGKSPDFPWTVDFPSWLPLPGADFSGWQRGGQQTRPRYGAHPGLHVVLGARWRRGRMGRFFPPIPMGLGYSIGISTTLW